jgi:hypothetical protein
MDQNRFDALTRMLSDVPSRRHLFRGLAWAGLGLGAVRFPSIADGKKKRRKKRDKKPKPNFFGCLNVGQPCSGDNAKCCSGICEGAKPKRGKQDHSRCVAHNELDCDADDSTCSESIPCGTGGVCYRTTGKAGFCGNFAVCNCGPCKKDADCEVKFGPGAACVVCTSDCAGVNGSQGTACVPAVA